MVKTLCLKITGEERTFFVSNKGNNFWHPTLVSNIFPPCSDNYGTIQHRKYNISVLRSGKHLLSPSASLRQILKSPDEMRYPVQISPSTTIIVTEVPYEISQTQVPLASADPDLPMSEKSAPVE